MSRIIGVVNDMADKEPESFIEKLTRETTLNLRAVGGRVFVENARPERLDRSVIELKCWWSPGLLAMFDTSIRVGEDKHKPLKWDDDGVEVVDEEAEEVVGWSLLDCAIMLTLYRAEDGWLADNAARKDDAVLGTFEYHAPIQTADGVVNDKRPSVFVWAALGRENFQMLRDRLSATEAPDFDLGVTVQFPRGTVESGWVDKKVVWDGKESLPVTGVTLVWKRGDWEGKSDRERAVYRNPEPEENEPPREHVELLGAMNRLEVAIAKLAIPVWLAAGAAILAVLFTR